MSDKNKVAQLDDGFQEVSLDEGFEEAPLDNLGMRAPSEDEMANTDISKYAGEADPLMKLEAANNPLGALQTKAIDIASFNLADELAGGLEAAGQAVGLKNMGAPNITDTELMSPVGLDKDKLLEIYNTTKAKRQARSQALQDSNKVASLVGTGVGTVASMPVSLGKVTQGLGKVLPAIDGAILGGMQAAGESQGSLTEDPLTLLKDTAKGAALGLGFGAGASLLTNSVSKAAPKLDVAAAKKALKALKFGDADLKGLSDDEILKLGKRALDEKLITPFSSADDVLEKLDPKVESMERTLVETLSKMQSAGVTPVNKKQLADEVFDKLKSSSEFKGLEAPELVDFKNKIYERLGVPKVKAPTPDMPEGLDLDSLNLEKADPVSETLTTRELQDKKVSLNTDIKDAGFRNDNPGRTLQTYKELRSGLRGALEKQAEEASDPLKAILPTDEALNLKEVNKDLGQLYKLSSVADKQARKSITKRGGADTAEKLGFLHSLMNKDAIGMLATGAMATARGYGDNMSALAANKAATMAKNAPKTLGNASNLVTRASAFQAAEDDETKGNVKSYADMSAEDLQMIAERALAGGTKEDEELATMLSLTAQKEGLAKTAELFKIMQNPKYRMKLNELKK